MGECPGCGKFCFKSRKMAKKYMLRRFPKTTMSVYRCRVHPQWFHFGHADMKQKKRIRNA